MTKQKNHEVDANANFAQFVKGRKFKTILADPPWQFQNRTGKVAPEHKRLNRYGTMNLDDIKALPVESAAAETSHLYLWVPNALLPEGQLVALAVREALHAEGVTLSVDRGRAYVNAPA